LGGLFRRQLSDRPSIFLVGSWLDDIFYDWLRRRTVERQVYWLAHRSKGLALPLRILIWLIFKNERNLAVDRAAKIKRQVLNPLQAKDAVNTFQWCKALLLLQSQDSLAIVLRFEADSKFFRSFVVVLLALVIFWACQKKLQLVAIGIPLILLAMWRYMEQRYRATNQAYWSVITLTIRGEKVVFPKPEVRTPSHAGGVVFRIRNGQPEYLLVEASQDSEEWVLSKGHIEDNENPRETAVREVHEETGIWAKIRAELACLRFSVLGTPVTVQCYLVEYAVWGKKSDRDRGNLRLSLDAAKEMASHPETREMLLAAE
jgi:ADP-ribose pyrophosphatase YjhB (NUDIX family)